jgi:L-asparagine transporter-like permease
MPFERKTLCSKQATKVSAKIIFSTSLALATVFYRGFDKSMSKVCTNLTILCPNDKYKVLISISVSTPLQKHLFVCVSRWETRQELQKSITRLLEHRLLSCHLSYNPFQGFILIGFEPIFSESLLNWHKVIVYVLVAVRLFIQAFKSGSHQTHISFVFRRTSPFSTVYEKVIQNHDFLTNQSATN